MYLQISFTLIRGYIISKKLEYVYKTIEELRKQLAEAEKGAAALNAEISSYKQSIENVRSKFSRQLGRLQKKEQSVKESRADWESERISLEKAKAAHEAVMAAHSEELLSRDKLIADIKSEIFMAQDFQDIVSKMFDDAGTNHGDEHLSTLDSEVLKFEAAVDEANQNVLSAESIIENLQEELSTIDVRIPILESEKKLAASNRDFKAAGKASKEIKDALARKEQCKAELAGEAMQRKKAAKDELEKATKILEEKKSIAAEKGKEARQKQMAMLREKIKDLKSILKKFGNAESGEVDAINVACVGSFVIDSQISALEAEGRSLGEKYGGWDNANEVAGEDAADVSVQSAPTFSSADGEDAAESYSSKHVINASVLEKYTFLCEEIQDLEAAVEKAVGEEDYDIAAELEEKAQRARTEIESWGFSTDDLEAALRNGINGESPVALENCENEIHEKKEKSYDSMDNFDENDQTTGSASIEDCNLAGEGDNKEQDANKNKTETESSDEYVEVNGESSPKEEEIGDEVGTNVVNED